MGKSKKGLADTGEGDFILNESGSSVSVDKRDDEQNVDDQKSAAESKELSDEK